MCAKSFEKLARKGEDYWVKGYECIVWKYRGDPAVSKNSFGIIRKLGVQLFY
jgi:hypothetical protein